MANAEYVKGGYWFKDSGFALNDIDSTLFTHLFCAFADLNPQTNQLVISPENQDSFRRFTATVRQRNPSVKTLLSIGGGGANTTAYGAMASQPGSRRSFINSTIILAREFGFHGLDLDWEYPKSATDMTNFGILLSEWRVAIGQEPVIARRMPLLLTAAVSYSPRVNGLNYPVDSVARNFDWINVMSYDFYGPLWSREKAELHAQLHDPVNHVSGSDGMDAWIRAGVPKQKLVLGVPFYGYAWKLVNPNINAPGAPAAGAAAVGSRDGSMTYMQITNYIQQNQARTVYNDTNVGNYCYSGSTWISYDDTQSITRKVSYIRDKGLLGYFAWHVGGDRNEKLSRAASQG